MKKMRRLLAALLVTTMLFGSNGFSYAAEAVGGDTQEAAQEVAAVEEPESEATEETAPEEATVDDTSVQETTESEDGEAEAETVEEAATEEATTEEAAVEEPDKTAESEEAAEAGTENSASGETEAAATEEAEGVQKDAAETGKTSEVKTEEEKPAVKTEYTYSDDKVDVVATLQRADAVPDDAELVVTPVTPQADGYNYDAYMDALNDQAEEGKEYNSDNTLLYDIAFMYEEKDAEGNGTGRMIEYQPESGSVEITISFKNGQLNEQISAEKADDVEILHLPLVDSVRDSVDTTADATDIDKNDINVETVQDENIDVNGESASFSVSGLSLIALSAPRKAASGGDSVTGTISFFNEEGTGKAPFTPADDDDYFVLVSIKAKEGEDAGKTVGWGIKQIPRADISGQQVYSFSVDEFYDFGEDGSSTDVPFVYNTDDYDIAVRFYHTPTPVTTYQEATEASDVITGYSFMGSKYGANASDSYHNPATINLIKKTLGAKFYVQIKANDVGSVSEAGDYWLAIKAKKQYGDIYHLEKLIISEEDFDAHNIIEIPITEWTNEDGNQPEAFSQNWTNFEAVIATRKPDKKTEPMTPKKVIGGEAGNNVDQINVGNLVGAYLFKEDKGVTSDEHDPDNIERRYVLEFEKIELESAITPRDVLGDAVNFGIVADTYNQHGHTETNFAVNSFSSDANVDVDGAGSEPPALFYVGEIHGSINPTERNTATLEIHTPKEEFSKLRMNNVSQHVYVYDTSKEKIAAYVQKLQAAGASKSTSLLGKTTIAPVSSGDKYTLDVSGLDDDTTIYVKADGIRNALSKTGGLNIVKKPGQYIVFNFEDSAPVNIDKFTVTTNGNTYESTTEIYGDVGGGADRNHQIEEAIITRITFNAANASAVHIKNASGLFLCPNANEVTNENGAGWILAKGTVTSQAEWHFFYHGRDNESFIGYQLKGIKSLVDKDGNSIPYENKGFSFSLYEEGEDGRETGDPIDTKVADQNGYIIFDRIEYDGTQVPRNQEVIFKYVIKEDTSGCEERDGKYYKDGIEYSTELVHVVVKAKNYSENNLDSITVEVTVNGTPVKGDLESVFEFGSITNKKEEEEETVDISAAKSWSPSVPAGASVVFTLCENGDPTDKTVTLDGTVDENGESEAWKATFKDLPKYDGETEIEYTVKETTGYVGYTASPESAADGGTITNTQNKVEISAKKAWSPSAPAGASVVFKLYKNGDPTEQTVTLDGTVDENGESEAWTATFTDLPEYDGETKNVYTVKETTGRIGYTASPEDPVADGGTITNTQDTVDISAKKAWSPSAPAGASVVFKLYKNGDPTEQTVTLDGEVDENGESTAWTATFSDLPEYDGETKNVYTVKETTGRIGYTASPEDPVADGGTITNTQNKVNISATKAWSPSAPAGASVVFKLYKNGDATEQTVTLDGEVDENGESTAWTATFSDLPEYDGEAKIVYTVAETTGVTGYTASTLNPVADGETITNTETEISVSKRDVNGSDELPGAMIQILKGEEVVEEWTSGTEVHVIKGLEVGTEYTLREITAPDGYTLAADTTFSIKQDGTVDTTGSVDGDTLLINDVKTKVKISKVDITSQEEIAGATLQILDSEGNVVVLDGAELSWVSSTEGPHIIEGLKTGVEYTLHEKTAPAGYTVAADTKFTIATDGSVTSGATQTEDHVLLVEDALTEVKVSKVDIADGKEVAGAEIKILDAEGKIADSWTSAVDDESTEDINEAVHVIRGLKTGVTYTLHEEVAPNGYTVTTDTTFIIDETGKVTSTGTVTENGVMLVEDAMTEVKVSKVDIAGGEELEGATIQIIGKDGKVVEQWTSKKDNEETEDVNEAIHIVKGLKTGEEYTLRETVAPNGYTVTADTKFTINANGTVTSTGTVTENGVMLVKDAMTEVKVSKADVADGEELEGAHIQIIVKEGLFGKETIVEEWTSEKDNEETEDVNEAIHIVKGLKTGVEYILRETVAPDGYTVTTDIKFSIDETGKVTSTGTISETGVLLVEDSKTNVKVSKVDVSGGKELAGATIQIIEKDTDGNEKVVEEWVSAEDNEETADVNEGIHIVEGLKTGVEYTLRETVAPDGYTVTADTTFTIDETGKVTSTSTTIKEGVLLVEDAKTKVSVSKTDIASGEELEGAHIQILDSEGKVVEEWDSTKKAHVVEGLKTGVTYTLKETVAPDGYTVTSETTFTIDEKGKVTSTGSQAEDGTLLVNDSKTRISVSKVDIADGKELAGATIQIIEKDADGNEKIVEKWVSKEDVEETADVNEGIHIVEGLKTGVEYTLRETVAPDGYTVTAETTFTIDEKGKVTTTASVSSDGTLLVEDAMTEIKVSKVDIADGEELEGAHIQIINKDGKVVEEWVSAKDNEETEDVDEGIHIVKGLKTGEEYTLKETVAPDGYTVTAETKFTIDETGKVTSTGTVTEDGVMLVEDAMTEVKVSKVDVADGEELEGATIHIIDKDGKVVEEWVSKKDDEKTEDVNEAVHIVKGLKTGEEYTLKETVAPEGYTVTTETTFTIDESGKVTSTGTVTEDGVMLVEDAKTKISVSKVDIADGKELEGAHIQIIDKDGKVVEEWDSTKEAHKVEGLKTGEEYTLKETVAPDGYTVTTDTTFTIDENGKVTSTGTVTENGVLLVEDAMTVVKVSKVDIADGKELEGAHIQIIDKDGKVVEEWTSTKDVHEVKGLKTGEEYTLRETVAPDGYTVTTDTKFTIDENGKVTSTGSVTENGVMLVEDAITVVKISKVDVADGKELEGAHIQIIRKGLFGKETVVEEWDSTKVVHEVKGLKTGVEYILRETVAPDGYTVTTDITFTIDENGKVTSTGTITEEGVMLVEDAMTVVKVSKVDVADGKELEGAKIQIIDENGNVVDEWTSTKEAHVVTGLKTGVKYTLHEVVAPNGYEIASDTTFTIDKYGNVTSSGTITKDGVLLVEDAKKEEQHKKPKKKDSTNTGDEAPLGVLFGGLGIGAIGLAVLLEDRKRRSKKN